MNGLALFAHAGIAVTGTQFARAGGARVACLVEHRVDCAAFGASAHVRFEPFELVAALAALRAGVYARDGEDEEADHQNEGAVWIEENLEHGEVNSSVGPLIQLDVGEGDERDSCQPGEHAEQAEP